MGSQRAGHDWAQAHMQSDRRGQGDPRNWRLGVEVISFKHLLGISICLLHISPRWSINLVLNISSRWNLTTQNSRAWKPPLNISSEKKKRKKFQVRWYKSFWKADRLSLGGMKRRHSFALIWSDNSYKKYCEDIGVGFERQVWVPHQCQSWYIDPLVTRN